MIGGGSDFSSGFAETAMLSSVDAQFADENICGEGASCIVYRMNIDGLTLAAKRLRREFISQPGYVASYRKEFQIGRRLKHDALPVYRELHIADDDVYIMMDYVDGVSAGEFIETAEGEKFFIAEDNIRKFLTQLVDAVGYLHRSGVIHCDLKPANILLRNSDRAVMLIDLDKSYCDVLDSTHGGTRQISDPEGEDLKPTASKDYNAIGRIVDIIAYCVPDFPLSKFRRFRQECDKPDASPEKLINALQPKSYAKMWWAIGGTVAIVAFATLLSRPKPTIVEPIPVAPQKDTVVTIIQTPAKPEAPVIELDSEMSDFITSAQASLKRLKTGKLTDAEIQDMSFKTVEAYTDAYNRAVNLYKTRYPDTPGVEIEMAIAGATEKSEALRLMQQLTQAASDTLTRRHPGFYE